MSEQLPYKALTQNGLATPWFADWLERQSRGLYESHDSAQIERDGSGLISQVTLYSGSTIYRQRTIVRTAGKITEITVFDSGATKTVTPTYDGTVISGWAVA